MTPGDLSVAQLEKLLNQSKDRLGKLLKKRKQLASQLAKVDKQIERLTGHAANGEAPKRGGKRGKRPKNAKNLPATIREVLSRTKSGYSLSALADKVKASGYKSHAANFKNVIYQTLYKEKDFVRDETSGTYKLKG
jgi:hypothetical protein